MTNKKAPIIGISGSIIVDQGGMFPGYRRSYVNEDYVKSVIKNGGVPLILPMTNDEDTIHAYIDCIDGLILSGGHDVSPHNYGEEPRSKLGEISPERDEYDFALIRIAKEKKIPILGICRGAQILNVYLHGNLWQDLSYNPNLTIKHSQGHSPDMLSHSVEIMPNSKLETIFKTNKMRVNSFHHQVIKNPGEGFKITAKAPDTAIEAIEHETYPFMVGVQWHPEMLHQAVPLMNELFKALINKAKEN